MKENRLRAIHILDQCKSCPNNMKYRCTVEDVEMKCAGCSLYVELRNIGVQLGKKKRPQINYSLNLTENEYIKLKTREYSDVEISNLYGISRHALNRWKRKHGISAKIKDGG